MSTGLAVEADDALGGEELVGGEGGEGEEKVKVNRNAAKFAKGRKGEMFMTEFLIDD